MTSVLIGSRALSYWNSNLKLKDDTDWDVISYENLEGCEIHNPDHLNNLQMLDFKSEDCIILPNGKNCFVMSMLGLAIIKRSHLWRNLSFQKHITMYHKFGLAQALNESIRINESVRSTLSDRTKQTKEKYPQKNPNLMQDKSDFFNDAVTKKYDHDYLHDLVAYYDKPLYSRMLKESNLAWCEKDKWNAFSEKDKLRCIAEETYVIAIERFMIPSNWKYPSKLAYMKALDKVCTTLTSNWFRDKAIDEYPAIVNLYDQQRFSMIQSKLPN